MRCSLIAAVQFLLLTYGCSQQPTTPSADGPEEPQSTAVLPVQDAAPDLAAWIGAYSSPSEIGGFSGTKLVVENGLMGEPSYYLSFYTDVISPDDIEQEMETGSVLIEGDRIYIPRASGHYRDGKPHLMASVQRYTKLTIKGHIVLMRDDALKAFRTENKLYDYGILIKVSDSVPELLNLDLVEHKSIKLLYDNPTKHWQDPFVSGPNER